MTAANALRDTEGGDHGGYLKEDWDYGYYRFELARQLDGMTHGEIIAFANMISEHWFEGDPIMLKIAEEMIMTRFDGVFGMPHNQGWYE